MRTHPQGDTLLVNEFTDLGASNAGMLRDLVRATLKPEHRYVAIDLSSSTFVDSEGLGALVGIHKAVVVRGGAVRLVNCSPMIRDLFRLTRLEGLFEFPSGS